MADSSTIGTNNSNQLSIFWSILPLYLQVNSNVLTINLENQKPFFFAALTLSPFMTVVQVLHSWWESIVVLQFHQAIYLPAMRSWFIWLLTSFPNFMDSKWNIIQQVSKTHQFKRTLNIIEKNAKFFGTFISLFKSDKN